MYEAAGQREQVSLCARHEDKEAREEEEGDEEVSHSFVIPSVSMSRTCVRRR